MPLSFSSLCDLLTQLERIEIQLPPPTPLARQKLKKDKVWQWFKHYRNEIDCTSAEALLSSLLPHRRRDRNYSMQEKRLSRIIGQSYGLGQSRLKDLLNYTVPGRGDLGACVERATRDLGPPAIPPVSIDELDSSLSELASRSRFSNPSVRLLRSNSDLERPLEWLYRRMDPRQAKWLTRLVLKDVTSFIPEDYQVLSAYHFLLPDLLRFQDSLPDALDLLKGALKHYPAVPGRDQALIYKEEASTRLCPKVGVKIGRPSFIKARSIQSCLKLLGPRRWSAERKYDGEHCEIHIDISKGSQCIQIYSKSGKDSTQDRAAVHGVIRDCLRLGKPDCPIKSTCILLGELVVYDDMAQEIAEFAKIRKHVSRSGSFLGTENDSQAHPHEHLMVVFYDLLTIDDDTVMNEPYQERRIRLSSILTKRRGRAMSAERKIIDCSRGDAREQFMRHFAWSITRRWEGLVLKPVDAPYFALHENDRASRYQGFIKVKRDYIASMGDEADFAVIGASYNARDAAACDIRSPRWTSFYLGCLENEDDVQLWHARPRFKVVGSVCCRECIPKADLETLCDHGQFGQQPFHKDDQPESFDLSFEITLPPMQTVFSTPLVVEVLGSAFERPSGANFQALRHPRIRKVHLDRSWKDTVSFSELQALAQKAREPAPEGESQELEKWVDAVRRTVPEARNTGSSSPNSSPVTPVASRPRQKSDTTQGTTGSPRPHGSSKEKKSTNAKSNVRSLVSAFVSSRPQQTKRNPSPKPSALITSSMKCGLILPIFEDSRKAPPASAPPRKVGVNGRRSELPQETSRPTKRPREPQDEVDGLSQRVTPGGAVKRARYTSSSHSEPSRKSITQLKGPLTEITNSPGHRQSSTEDRSLITDYTESAQSSRHLEIVSTSPEIQSKGFLRQEKRTVISPPSRVWEEQTIAIGRQQMSWEVSKLPKKAPVPHSLPWPNLSKCILYLAPCIAQCPWIAEDLTLAHGIFSTHFLDQWARERGFDADSADDSVVYESQSYANLQKVVLLETRREKASMRVVQEVLDLELRETVMLWDWRLLEDMHTRTYDREEESIDPGKHYFGVIDWDGQGRYHYFADSSGARRRICYGA